MLIHTVILWVSTAEGAPAIDTQGSAGQGLSYLSVKIMTLSTIIYNVKFGLQVAALGDFMAIHRALSSNRCTQLRSYFGHIGGHLEFHRGHVNNTKYAFHRKIYPTPINFTTRRYLQPVASIITWNALGGNLPPRCRYTGVKYRCRQISMLHNVIMSPSYNPNMTSKRCCINCRVSCFAVWSTTEVWNSLRLG